MSSVSSPQHSLSEPLTADYRYELKLASDSITPAQARSWIRLHPEGFRVAYPPRMINNLYFDTVDLQSFNDNLSGLSERRKLRIRWYGPLDSAPVSDAVLELKIKENMLGSKKQQRLDIALDLTRPFVEIWQTIRVSVNEEWQSQMLAFTQPTLINRYRREYFVSPDKTVRATLDYDLTAYGQRMTSRPNLDRRLPLPSAIVIEVKAAPAYQKRLQQVMGFFPIPRSRSSKYVSGVTGGPF